MQDYINAIALVASLITIFSVSLNVIQFMRRRQENKTIRSLNQENYNGYFLIGRACNRARNNKNKSTEKKLSYCLRELDYIRGLIDVERNSIIAYCREHLNFTPFFEHPAHPGEEVSKDVLFGMPPDEDTCVEINEND